MRTAIRTKRETLASGVVVERRSIVEKGDLEWRLQAEAVRRLKAMPEYDRLFTIAGDMNAAKRGPQDQIKAKATGLAPGDPDLRVYLAGGRLCMIEYKAEGGRLSPAQVERHATLKRLGFDVVVVKARTAAEAAESTLRLVRAWLPSSPPANDDQNLGVAA